MFHSGILTNPASKTGRTKVRLGTSPDLEDSVTPFGRGTLPGVFSANGFLAGFRRLLSTLSSNAFAWATGWKP